MTGGPLPRRRGRPPALDPAQARFARRARSAGVTISELARRLQVSRVAVRRALRDTTV
jgi:DNA invertase Pin-like site-specific DNA recombinase